MAQWRCRICDSDSYHQVAVLRSNGTRYLTSFFACSGCSVMFLNDTTFNALHVATVSAGAVPVVTPLRRRS
jgi:hypothetical protein